MLILISHAKIVDSLSVRKIGPMVFFIFLVSYTLDKMGGRAKSRYKEVVKL